MPAITADLGSNSVAVAALAGAVDVNVPLLLRGTDTGLVGPLTEGTGVTVTVAQGGSTLTLAFGDGTGARTNGANLDLFAEFPFPLPAGFTQGAPAETITWAGFTASGPFSFTQTGTIQAPSKALLASTGLFYRVRQGDTHWSLPFYVSADEVANAASAALYLAPVISGNPLLPMPAIGLNTQVLTIGGLTSTPPFLRLDFPAGWGSETIPAGEYNAWASVTYADGSLGTLPLWSDSAMTTTATLIVYGVISLTQFLPAPLVLDAGVL